MGRRQKPAPRSAAQALAAARAWWRQHRYDEALRSYSDALRQTPNDLALLLEASRAFASRYQVERAIALLERAQKLGSRNSELQRAVGEGLLHLGRTADAEACFRRASRLAADPLAQLALAEIHERRHELDAADELAAAATRAAPSLFRAHLLRARIARRRGNGDEAYAALRRLIASAGRNASELPETYGELCILLDELGQYDAAWDAMVQGKRLQHAEEADAWSAAQFVMRRCSQMYGEIFSEHIARWRENRDTDDTRRAALLTGFPRSGTTLLEQVLDAHPDVVSSEELEVFGAVVLPQLGEGLPADAPLVAMLDGLSGERLERARRTYWDAMEAMLGEPIGTRLHLDKNPAMNPMIVPLRRVFPEMIVVVALRDPRDVVVSCFLRWMPVNPMSVWFLTLERTVDRYLMDLRGWLRVRELIDGWAEIRYEDLVADLPGQARRAVAALGLPWDDAVLAYRDRPRRPVQSPTYEAVAKPVYRSAVGRWRNYERHLAPVLERLEPMVTALGYDA
jgi:tetratricopeptide (TPR) repeat protein